MRTNKAHLVWCALPGKYIVTKEDSANNQRINYETISNLTSIDVGTVFLWSCNTAKNDTTAGDKNIANAFLNINGVKSVVAADGYSFMYVSIFGNTRFKSDFNNSGKKGNYSAPQGYILLTKNSDGSINRQVIYSPGKYFNVSDLYKICKVYATTQTTQYIPSLGPRIIAYTQ